MVRNNSIITYLIFTNIWHEKRDSRGKTIFLESLYAKIVKDGNDRLASDTTFANT